MSLSKSILLGRRNLLQGFASLGGGALVTSLLPAWARSQTPGLKAPQALTGEDIALTIGHAHLTIGGRTVGGTADAARRAGEQVRDTRLVFGLRAWF